MFDTAAADPGGEGTALREVSDDALEEQIVDLAARIASATCRWLVLVAEFDRREAHQAWGYHDCASQACLALLRRASLRAGAPPRRSRAGQAAADP